MRQKLGIETPQKNNYTEIERIEKKFAPLFLPKSLKKNLPFKTREKTKFHNEQK